MVIAPFAVSSGNVRWIQRRVPRQRQASPATLLRAQRSVLPPVGQIRELAERRAAARLVDSYSGVSIALVEFPLFTKSGF